MLLLKPQKLEVGDTIAIISPSAGLAAIIPHRLDNAIKFLENQGYKIKEFSCTRKNDGWQAASAEERAKNIMDAFKDKKVKAIIASIGGTVANQTLRYLDYKIIKKNPKIFCGYSDNSNLHYALFTQTGLVTFYGPCAMTQFGEYPEPLNYTMEHFCKALTLTKPMGKITPSEEWTDETLDWGNKLDLERPRKMKKNPGFEWLRKGKANGQIIGGCLSSIIHLSGTKYWPDYKEKILFLEIPEGQEFNKGEPLAYVDWYLEELYLLNTFSQIKGLVFGRPFKYSDEDTKILKNKILERTKDYDFPILFGADIGHTDPMITIPIGTKVALDSETGTFEFLENGVI